MRAVTIHLGWLGLRVLIVSLALAGQTVAGDAKSQDGVQTLAVPGPCLPEPDSADSNGGALGQALRHYVRGLLLMGTSQHALAAEHLQRAAALTPNVGRIWRHLGFAHYQAGNLSGAVETLDEALRLRPSDLPSLYLRGRAANSLRQPKEAIAFFDALLKSAPEGSPYRVLGLYRLARTYHELGDVDKAIANHEELLEALGDPKPTYRRYSEIYRLYRGRLELERLLSRLYLLRGDNDKAIHLLRSVLAKQPDGLESSALICRAYIQKRDFSSAREWARKLIEAHPRVGVGYARLAEIYRAEGRPEGVIPELEACRREAPENVAPALELAAVHEAAGRPVDALEALAAAITGGRAGAAVLMRAARLIDGLEDPERVYQEAQRLVTDEAERHGPFVLVAMLAENLGRGDEAIGLYDKAIEREPKAAICYSRKAELLIRAGRLEEALGVYQAAVDRALALPVFRRKMGMLLQRLDRVEEAVAEYRQVLQAVPDDKMTRYLLAAALLHLQKLDEAVGELKALLARFPKEIRAYSQLASLYLKRGELDKAEATLERARELDPKAVAPRAILAELRYRQRRYDEAERLAREILAKHPEQKAVRLLLAYVLAGQDRHEDAVAELQALLAAEPKNIGWRYLLSGIYTEMGNTQAAERELLRILQDKPDYGPANNDLGYMWADRGVNLTRAENMIRRALKADPGSAAYLDSMGWVLYKRGRFEEAIKMLEGAARRVPDLDAVIWDHLGDAYWRLSRPKEAGEAWQKAIAVLESRSDPAKGDDLKRVRQKVKGLEETSVPEVAPLAAQDELEDDEPVSHHAPGP